LTATALSGLGGCADLDEAGPLEQRQQAIYYGSRQPTVTPMSAKQQMAIGYLTDASGEPWCSGTLIDRDVVVTAQHCTEGASPDAIDFGVGDPSRPDAVFKVQSISEHDYLDVALLFLHEDAVSRVPGIEPLPFLRRQLEQGRIGSSVEAAGYGATHDDSTGRYFAALTLKDITEEYYVVDGGGQRGICFGDSGGPLLVSLDGHAAVAGVESWGDESCVDVDNLTRLDLVADWIDGENGNFDPNSPSQPGSTTGSGGSSGKPPADSPGSSQDPSDGPTQTPPSDDDDFPTTWGCAVGSHRGAPGATWLLLAGLGLIALRRPTPRRAR
jgi:MYXO-CTERM domain-containing protein